MRTGKGFGTEDEECFGGGEEHEDPEWPKTWGLGGEGGEPWAGEGRSAGVWGQVREGLSTLPEAKGPGFLG